MTVAVPALTRQQFSPADSSYLEQFRGKAFGEIVPKVWLEVCALNRAQYADSNLVKPGDVIALPLGRQYIAKPGGTDHMWQASLYFTNEVVTPHLGRYLPGTVRATVAPPDTVKPAETTSSGFPWVPIIFLFLFVLLAIAAMALGSRRLRRQPFVKHPPDFRAAADSQIRPVAERALREAFGQGTQIVGPIVRGTIDGQQTMFFGGGSHSTERFRNEPGYQARVRFPDGTEAPVVSRWSCFNPVWSAVGARFEGTFTPEGGQPQVIERISEAQATHLGQAMRDVAAGREPAVPVSTIIPGRQPAPAPAVQEPPTASKVEAPIATPPPVTEKVVRASKLRISAEGLTIDGTLELDFDQLRQLVEMVPEMGGKDAPKVAAK